MSSNNGIGSSSLSTTSSDPSSTDKTPMPPDTANTVELNTMKPIGVAEAIGLEMDIMQLARLGEIAAIKKLFDSGKYDISYRDEEGITPLHWAAINNRYELCKFLLDSGADVNAKGGESVATPAMWAAQRCHHYIVHLLLQYGADPLLTDIQGFNIMHLATIDGNSFLLVLLLHQEIPVDIADPQGHTGLMWAAYKGFPVCVDVFLRWGADVNAADEGGLSPLHWALVKGSTACVQKIIEYGADRFAETKEGKTPSIVADEMKTTHIWHHALGECGYEPNGTSSAVPSVVGQMLRSSLYMSRFYFLLPFFSLPTIVTILSSLSIYVSIPTALLFMFGVHLLIKWVSKRGPLDFRVLQRTAFPAGFFSASAFWVALRWLHVILPTTYSSSLFLNLIFLTLFAFMTYFYTYSMIEDPGFVPKLSSRNEQKAVIMELINDWSYDEDHFCVPCMIRRPLRSKHCRRCKRCVSKQDHHCPWINNCVGNNNFRHFMLYLILLLLGIVAYVRLVFLYYSAIVQGGVKATCNLISPWLCNVVETDTYTFVLTIWTSLQLIWVTMLTLVQLYQISRGTTTFEVMRGHGHRFSHRAPTSPNQAPSPAESHNHSRGSCFTKWKSLFGLDAFMAAAQDGLKDGRSHRRRQNPFSHGIVRNCQDFWCDPAPYFGTRQAGSSMLGGKVVNYYKMYDAELLEYSGGRV
ncbi:palmitoyltransferase [Trichophyton tonsurans CBS 112818]|uniref:Palmitoyltransferase n=1 Tax=Trichophyton tonsurans (strain CBS 112818) TaxID=647933 RepID=F2RTR2_TRIT1|nr:palmitoyltransferase [Trichophyton tonsurans CBS 112818]